MRSFASLRRARARLPLALGILAVVVLLLVAEEASGAADYLTASGIALAVWALAGTLWFIAAYEGDRPVAAVLLLLMGPVYAGFFLGHGLAIYDLASGVEGAENVGRNWLLFTLAGTSASDTGAYAIGRLTGRHQMTPSLSPNKTWEGAAGGFIAAVLAIAGGGCAAGSSGVPLAACRRCRGGRRSGPSGRPF